MPRPQMNTATERKINTTATRKTSPSLNSRPEAADPKTRTARAGMKPAYCIRMPNKTMDRGRTIFGPQRPTTLDLFAVEQSPDHDVDAERNEEPPQKTRKVARPHPQRRPDRVAPGSDHRRRATRVI